MWQQYFTPGGLDEVIDLLDVHRGHARVVAGATDLILELERGLRPGITTLIDISRLAGLDEIRSDDEGRIHLGCLVTHNQVAASRLIVERAFTLARACWEVGAPQIRNRGTVAGNLITASPANDSITPLMALRAEVTLRSKSGERRVPLSAFYTGVRRTVLREDELLTSISFPAPTGLRSAFYKLALRRAQAISVVNVAVVLKMDGPRVGRASITLGAVAPTIIHAPEAEAALTGRSLSPDTMQSAADLAAAAAHPIDDLRASAAYRRKMVGVSTLRCLRTIATREERSGYPDRPITLWGAGSGRPASHPKELQLHQEGTPIETTINGRGYTFTSGQDKSLLRLLREEGGLIGTKEGCAEGECGACTVFLDGMAVMACMVPAPRAHGAEVVTIEGLARDGRLHPVQQAFIDEGAVQCGYCTPGFLMAGAKLLEERPKPAVDDIQQALTGNLCRCTGYYSIISAIERAADALA